MVPAVRLEQPQVRLPADSNGAPQEIQRRTFITMGERPASLRAIFFCSMSLTTLGGKVFIFRPSTPVGAPGAFAAGSAAGGTSDVTTVSANRNVLRYNMKIPLLRHLLTTPTRNGHLNLIRMPNTLSKQDANLAGLLCATKNRCFQGDGRFGGANGTGESGCFRVYGSATVKTLNSPDGLNPPLLVLH